MITQRCCSGGLARGILNDQRRRKTLRTRTVQCASSPGHGQNRRDPDPRHHRSTTRERSYLLARQWPCHSGVLIGLRTCHRSDRYAGSYRHHFYCPPRCRVHNFGVMIRADIQITAEERSAPRVSVALSNNHSPLVASSGWLVFCFIHFVIPF